MFALVLLGMGSFILVLGFVLSKKVIIELEDDNYDTLEKREILMEWIGFNSMILGTSFILLGVLNNFFTWFSNIKTAFFMGLVIVVYALSVGLGGDKSLWK